MMQSKTMKNVRLDSKIPFDVVELAVQAMFEKGREEDELLVDFLNRVDDFIESCGWEIDEYESYRKNGSLN
jgi:hypothetical protein